MAAAEAQRLANLAAERSAQAAAQAGQRRADQLADIRVAAAARLRAAEDATAAAATRMVDLAAQRQEAERRLAQQAADLGPLLPLIERLDLYPLETLLAVPAPPDQTLRGVTVLQGIARDLERQAELLQQQQQQVARLTAAMRQLAPRLAAAEQDQASQAKALDAQIAQVRQTISEQQQQAEAAARAAADAAGRAATLRDVIVQIEAARLRAEAAATAEAARAAKFHHATTAQAARARLAALAAPAGPGLGMPHGTIATPVAGHVIRAFGAATQAGPANGISYQPPPAARVVSPCAGRVLFAAPFRSYGRLLIIDCGKNDDFVLAGLDRLDVPVGRAVRAGEPVGAMPGWDPAAPTSHPTLYLELRHAGIPINPAPFLGAAPF